MPEFESLGVSGSAVYMEINAEEILIRTWAPIYSAETPPRVSNKHIKNHFVWLKPPLVIVDLFETN